MNPADNGGSDCGAPRCSPDSEAPAARAHRLLRAVARAGTQARADFALEDLRQQILLDDLDPYPTLREAVLAQVPEFSLLLNREAPREP